MATGGCSRWGRQGRKTPHKAVARRPDVTATPDNTQHNTPHNNARRHDTRQSTAQNSTKQQGTARRQKKGGKQHPGETASDKTNNTARQHTTQHDTGTTWQRKTPQTAETSPQQTGASHNNTQHTAKNEQQLPGGGGHSPSTQRTRHMQLRTQSRKTKPSKAVQRPRAPRTAGTRTKQERRKNNERRERERERAGGRGAPIAEVQGSQGRKQQESRDKEGAGWE